MSDKAQSKTTAAWPVGQVEIKDCRVTYSVSSSELLLAINDIHLRALAAHHGGDDGSIMLEIEQITEDIIDRACNEGAGDSEFTTDAVKRASDDQDRMDDSCGR